MTPTVFRRPVLLALLLFLVVGLAYQPVWKAGFIWDDDKHLTENPCVVGPLGLKEIWTSAAATYFPLVLTSFRIEHALWGLNPLPYHLVNVALHGLCALLLWLVLRQLNLPGAWLGAALWALHPVQVESVAWITEMKNTQSGVFYLLTMVCFLRWIQAVGPARPKYYGAAVLCAVLAILSKSSTVMLPLVLGLIWCWLDPRWSWSKTKALAPFLFLSVAAGLWTIWEQKFHSGARGLEWSQTIWERLALSGCDAWFYLGKLLWPHPLIFIYPRWEIRPSQLGIFVPTLAVILGLYGLGRRRHGAFRPLSFVLAYFVISLFPVLGFFDVYFFRYAWVADHFQYLASMGPLAIAGVTLTYSWERWFKKIPLVSLAVVAALLTLLCAMTWRQSQLYANKETLYRDTIARNPQCWMAHNNLGVTLYEQGRLEEAILNYRASLQLNPHNMEAYTNLGLTLSQQGHLDEALATFRTALPMDPLRADTHYGLGRTLALQGQPVDAIAQLQQAYNLKPDDRHFQNGLAWMLVTVPGSSHRNGSLALELALKANQASGRRDPLILRTLAAAYAETGHFTEAVETAQQALSLLEEQGLPTEINGLRWELKLYHANRPIQDDQ